MIVVVGLLSSCPAPGAAAAGAAAALGSGILRWPGCAYACRGELQKPRAAQGRAG